MAEVPQTPESHPGQTEYQADRFGQQITQAYDTSIKALRRLGKIHSYKGSYGINPRGDNVDLNGITSPSNPNGYHIENMRVQIDLPSEGDSQALVLEWRQYDEKSHLVSTEGIKLSPGRYPYQKPRYSWYRQTGESPKTEKFEIKSFDGKFGSTPDSFTQNDYLMGRLNPTVVARSLEAKSKTAPNPIARLLGR